MLTIRSDRKKDLANFCCRIREWAWGSSGCRPWKLNCGGYEEQGCGKEKKKETPRSQSAITAFLSVQENA